MDSRCSPDFVAHILEVDGYLMPHEDHIPLALGIVETASEVSAHLVEDNHISILRLFFKIFRWCALFLAIIRTFGRRRQESGQMGC